MTPRTVTLTAAYAVLLVFLLLLAAVFADERAQTHAELEARRLALAQYVKVSLDARLHDLLAAQERRLAAALADPLVDAEGLLYVTDGERLLPYPPPRPLESTLAADDEASEEPFVASLQAARTDADVERTVRSLLAHRARWRLPVAADCAPVFRIVELLLERGRAAPSLLAGLLRDGFPGQDGLQRELLRHRGTVSDEALATWCPDIARLSRRAGVPADDFEARCATRWVPDDALPALDAVPEGGSQLGGWYVERQGRVVKGLQVDAAAELQRLQAAMLQAGLIVSSDRVSPEGIESPRWAEGASRATGLYRLKVGLLGFSAVLGAGLLGLAVVAQRRKLRFVQMKEDFVAAVSHELKTPLASMRVMAETLELRLDGNPDAKDYPRRLVSEVDGLHALVENILSFGRIDKGRWTLDRSRVALASLQPRLEEDAAAWSAPVKLSFEGFDAATLDADRELLELCLLNLLRNACRYNARNPVEVAFSFAGRTLRVRDNGIGIEPNDRERVFDDFVRLKSQKATPRPGSGLGLALCRRVMAMHGGSIAVESSGPDGTVFALHF